VVMRSRSCAGPHGSEANGGGPHEPWTADHHDGSARLSLLSGAAGGAQAAEAIGGGSSTAAKLCQKGGWEGLVTSTGQPVSSEGTCVVDAAKGDLVRSSTSSLVFELGTCLPDSIVCPESSLVGYGLMPGAIILFCELGPDYTSDVCHAAGSVEQDGTVSDGFDSLYLECRTGWVFTFKTTTAAGTSIEASVTCEGVAATAPRAVGNAYPVDLGASLVVSAPGVLRNDSDPNGDVLRAVLVSGPAHGTLTLNANGSLRYTPSEDFIGVDSFRYKASDGSQQSAAATVRLTVRAVCGGMTATKVGTGAADAITGTSGADAIVGLGGNDTIRGLAGNDRVCGGSGADSIGAGAGADVLIGGSGNDVLRGGLGNDRLFGGAGADLLFGADGNDRLDGGANSPDRCDGGPGRDTATSSCEQITGAHL
jgi:Big-like domain-containing protein/hemolysin type calcium-binding protein